MFLYIKNCHHNDELDNYLKHDKLPHTIECSRVTCMKKLAFSLWCIVQRKREREISHHVANYADYKSLNGILLHKNGR